MEPASLVAPAQPHRPFALETKQPQDVPESGKRKHSEYIFCCKSDFEDEAKAEDAHTTHEDAANDGNNTDAAPATPSPQPQPQPQQQPLPLLSLSLSLSPVFVWVRV
ncbi:uncharacterized protein PG986_015072 [Apiospora aurea]|uniref:Uncharacterized protein n=1 Tax=Apiospora aurea TaxID=335848 RepID=A0ABR1PRJ0_9PEZI